MKFYIVSVMVNGKTGLVERYYDRDAGGISKKIHDKYLTGYIYTSKKDANECAKLLPKSYSEVVEAWVNTYEAELYDARLIAVKKK